MCGGQSICVCKGDGSCLELFSCFGFFTSCDIEVREQEMEEKKLWSFFSEDERYVFLLIMRERYFYLWEWDSYQEVAEGGRFDRKLRELTFAWDL